MNFSVLIGGACVICNYFLGVPKLESIQYLRIISCHHDPKCDLFSIIICVKVKPQAGWLVRIAVQQRP